jgi:hypothetical protein
MQTLRLRVDDGIYEKLLWLLSKFNKDEIEIIPETADFKETQLYLTNELNEMINGKANFIELNEAEERLEKIIQKHENRT